ncbi:MAG: hypoxanthine phosphoribosyltransferase [Verrucomicrobia bacterium]|nr:hypoxanthine phosphoribosyltransferase [Verrucomicrobiota bacterium]
MDSNLTPLIEEQRIASKIKEVAAQIKADYRGKDLVVVMVMKGALCLVADLIRELDVPLDVEYVQCSSYGQRGAHRGELEVIGLDRLNIHNRDVLIVDDIFDSGHTLATLKIALQQKNPRSVKSLVLLVKNVPHVTDYRPDYVLFSIENLFVVGYGLDYKERYRGLSGVYVYGQQ